ncbi:MAG: GntR family transcriptional regulator [Phycisphaeraceae bacterium]|nr:GntR family transcriptional regulator [Phycisphaeraceae bacterium]
MITAPSRLFKHQKIAQLIRQRIQEGRYQSGQLLPSVRMLADEFGVSANAVYRAVKLLQHEASLEGVQGHGIRVLNRPDQTAKASMYFAFICPYSPECEYYGNVQSFLAQAMSGRQDHCLTRHTDGSLEAERQAVTSTIEAGVQGLLVWPVESSGNADFFNSILKKIPIVFVDRVIENVLAPSVTQDCYKLGCDIMRHLHKQGAKRPLILEETLDISPYRQLYQGMRDTQTPGMIVDFKTVDTTGFALNYKDNPRLHMANAQKHLKAILAEQHYDALFARQDMYLDMVYTNTSLANDYPVNHIVSVTNQHPTPRSLAFYEHQPQFWIGPTPEMLTQGLTLLDGVVHLGSKHRREYKLPFWYCTPSATNANIIPPNEPMFNKKDLS